MFQPNPISTYSLFSRVGGSVLFHRFNVGDYDLLLLFPFFSKIFLLRNRKWLVLLFRPYLLSASLVAKPLVKVQSFASMHFFDILSPPFYFAKLAQTVLARAHILFTSIFFSDFLGAVAPNQKLPKPRGENNIGYLLPCSPAFCLLVFST